MKSSKKKSKKRINKVDPLVRDLSELLQSDSWQRIRFELLPKNKTITIRMSENLLDAVKVQAEKSGMDYQKFIRLMLEKVVAKAS